MNTVARRLAAIAGAVLWLAAIGIGPVIAASPPPGPPFPPPVDGQAVYDFAGVLSPAAIADAEATIDAIEERTGAEVVIYTQDAGTYDLTTEGTEGKARALIDQWGIGRAGFNDGMVIFLDLDPSLEHGQVQLYAAPGFEAAFLTNAERQSIYENDMLPFLRRADFDGAVGVAMQRIDAAATAEHANAAPDRAPGQRGRGTGRGADRVLRPVRLGDPVVAAVRQGPGLPRRPVDPHAGAAARPDRRVRGDGHGRRTRRVGR